MPRPRATPRRAPPGTAGRLFPLVLGVGALDFGLEQFMVVPILPAVQRVEGASLTATTWLLTGFLLAAVVTAPMLSRLGDLYGRRRLLLVSIAAFAAGSLVCALSTSVAGLIAGRVVQGMGAALGPLTIGLARDQAPHGRAPIWIGVLIALAGAGAAVGLVLGGLLVEHASIAAVFWFLFALAATLLVLSYRLVPETQGRDAPRPDWGGGLLLAAGLVAALLAISQGNAWGWSSLRVVALFTASAALLAAFVARERSTRAPLLDVRLLARRPVWSANLVAFAMGFGLFIAGVIVPQIAAAPEAAGYGLGLTLAETGLLLMPGALAIVLGGWLGGSLVRKTGARAVVACGAVAAASAYASLAIDHGSVASIAAANVPLGFGVGLAFSSVTNLVVHAVGEPLTSVFASTTAVSRSVGAALGAQVAAAIVIAGGLTGAGFPAERGFTGAFVLGLIASLVALGAAIAIPARSSDPLAEGAVSGIAPAAPMHN